MALNRVSRGQTPAQNDAAINAAIGAIDGIGANLEAQVAGIGANVAVQVTGLNGRIDAEGKAREANVNALQQQIVSVRDAAAGQVGAEASTRKQADDALRKDLDAADARATLRRSEFVSLASRPGDSPLRFAFVSDLAALSGPDQALPVLPDALHAFGDAGTVARVRGAGIVATRQAYPVEPGRAYGGRFVFQRHANPSDPSNDSVRVVLVWLDQARNVLPGGITVVADDQTLLAAGGRREVRSGFSRSPGAGLLVAPAVARYVRLAVECFGLDGLTDVEVIDRIDTTDATLLDPVSADALADVVALKSQNAGPRLTALEQQAQNPNSLTFATRSDAAAGAIPGTVTTVATRGRDEAGDGRDGLYERVATLPAGSDGFTNAADGSRWLRVLTAQDVFDATFQAPFMDLVGRRPDLVGAFGFRATGASAVRSLSERAADRPSVRDFGARLDGVTDDLASFDAARAAAGELGSVEVPPGPVRLNGTPTAGSSGPILWRLSGNRAGGFPLTGIGNDIVETFIERSKYFGQSETRHENSPVLRVDQRVSHSHTAAPGSPELVIPAFKIHQFVEPSGRLDDFPWAFSTTTRSKAFGKAQIVGIASQMIRPSDALADGQGPRAQLWGSYIEVDDETNQPSNLAGAMVGIEMGLFANSGDPTGLRTALDIGIGRRNGSGTAARFNKGLQFGCADAQYGLGKGDHSFFGKVIAVETNFDTAAFDTTGALAIGGAPAIRLADGHRVAFDTGGARHLRWEGGGLRYGVGSVEVFNVLDDGTVNIVGALKLARDLNLGDTRRIVFDSGGNHTLRWEGSGLRYVTGGVEAFNILDDGQVNVTNDLVVSGDLHLADSLLLRDGKAIAFNTAGSFLQFLSGSMLNWSNSGTAQMALDIDTGKLTARGGFSAPDQQAPSSTGDTAGSFGDIRFSGQYMFRKTSSGWYRVALSPF